MAHHEDVPPFFVVFHHMSYYHMFIVCSPTPGVKLFGTAEVRTPRDPQVA